MLTLINIVNFVLSNALRHLCGLTKPTCLTALLFYNKYALFFIETILRNIFKTVPITAHRVPGRLAWGSDEMGNIRV